MDQKQQLLLDATRRLIRRGAYPNLAKLLAKTHPADIAHLFRYLELKEQRTILSNILLYQRIYQEIVLLNSEGQEQIRLSRTSVILDDELESRAGSEEFLFPVIISKRSSTGSLYFQAHMKTVL